jgi:hypothetical protein
MDLGHFGTEFLYSAIIAVIFAGAGRLWNLTTHRRASATAGLQMGQVMGGLPTPRPVAQPAPQPIARHGVNYGRVLLHVGVFQFIVNIVAFVIGFLLGAVFYLAGQSAASEGSQLLFTFVIFLFGTFALIIGFLIIGLRVERSIRWLHMTYVALGVAASTLLINWLTSALHPANTADFIGAVIFALVQTFLGMGIGGGLSFLIGGRQGAPPAPLSQPYPYGAPPSAPLSTGQAVGPSRPLYPLPGPQPYPPPYAPQPPSPYPPQQGQHGAPYRPHPGGPQYPPQGAPQYPHPPAGAPQPYPPNAGQPPRYPPQYPPPQQPTAGGQGGEGR